MKVHLAKDIVLSGSDVKVSNSVSRENIGESLQNILMNRIEELRQTINMIDANSLSIILEHIQNAHLVQLCAVGNTIPVAINGQYMFNEIGIPAVSGTVWETQLAFARSLRKGDVLIAISNSGESKQVVKMLRIAKDGGAIIIGITNNPTSTVGTESDYHIQTATREKLFLNEFAFSRVSAMTIIEILCLFLTVGNKDSYRNLSACENLFADEKM